MKILIRLTAGRGMVILHLLVASSLMRIYVYTDLRAVQLHPKSRARGSRFLFITFSFLLAPEWVKAPVTDDVQAYTEVGRTWDNCGKTSVMPTFRLPWG